ncbi:MAG: YfhO family protein, partial [Porcipelethomonas sp.]
MKFFRKHRALSHCIILSAIYFLFILIIIRSEFAFGSCLDWCSQHYPFPDYFRKLFYKTGDLFPDFAPHCGAGENIYSLSYYGLFSPMLLLSYLFPFVEMSGFVQIFSVISMWAGVILFYNFARRRFKLKTAFIGGILFVFSAPLVFHSHRHIMFVNYMPFLIAALEGADIFIRRNIKTPLIIFTAFIIFSSYFFSIPSIIAITIYAVYSFIGSRENFCLKDFAKTGIKFAGCIAVSVSIAAILLLPTFAAIPGSRDATNTDLSAAIFIPFSSLGAVILSPHSFGLSSFGLFSVISAIFLKKSSADRFLGIALAVIIFCPVIICLLNGGMYVDGKVLIPFIPPAILLSLKTYERLRHGIRPFAGCFFAFAAVM